ncbi:MAG TPA: outer membrane beta-barrel protein [Puia sp.]|nr:outer membrane beta-barrel protein [Puia sp.]
MKIRLTTLTLIGMTLLVHAQQTPQPGYIVRSSGDTVHGYLKEVLTGDLVNQVGFKANPADNDFTLYSPSGVKAFQFDGGNAYRALTFTNPQPEHSTPQTTFVRLLVSGECELYSLHDKSVLYFLVRRDTVVHLLYDDDLHTIPDVKGNFRNELNFFAVGCESARSGIERLDYNEETLLRFFRELDACLAPGQATTTYYHKAKAHFGFFAYAGGFVFSDSRSQFTGEARVRLTYPQLKANVSFNLGFRYANVVRQVVDQNYLVATIHRKVTYSMTSIPFTIQYNFTRGIVQPYLFAGLSMLRNDITSTEIYPPTIGDTYYRSWNVSGALGGGIEVSLTNFLQARVEWRYEDFAQFPTAGLSVRF